MCPHVVLLSIHLFIKVALNPLSDDNSFQHEDAFREGLVFAIPSHSMGFAFEIKTSLCLPRKTKEEKKIEIICYFRCSLGLNL